MRLKDVYHGLSACKGENHDLVNIFRAGGQTYFVLKFVKSGKGGMGNTYTRVCPPVRGDNPLAKARAL